MEQITDDIDDARMRLRGKEIHEACITLPLPSFYVHEMRYD